jgi:L-ascorbate metabolism protein UlaG (beta-lactamase superfamily)
VDLVTISHKHFDHCYISSSNIDTKVIDTLGKHEEAFCTVYGIATYHDKENGLKRGPNIIYIIEMDEFRICHLGDLGHTLDENIIDMVGKVDVLMIPVGGNFTINGLEAAEITKLINPTYVIPMHYKTPKLTFELDGPEKFLTAMKNIKKISTNSFVPEKSVSSINNVIFLT